jgi:hypothetical protein
MSNYGVNTDTKEQSASRFIDVDAATAIAAGRFIKDLSYGVTENGNKYFEVIIVDKEGATAARKYFEPVIDETYIKTPADLTKSINKFNAVVANLTRRFLGDNYAVVGATSFEGFAKKVIEDVKKVPGWDKIELRVKLIRNKEGFPTLPSYAPIFEGADLPLAESKLKITRFDNVDPDRDAKVTPDAEVDTTEIDAKF